ncbi:MAG: cysteine synthase A [Thermoplasmata archaeon]
MASSLIYSDISETVGNTPLVRLNKLTRGLKAEVLVKVEGRNPAYSVKCRLGVALIKDAEQKGLLKLGSKDVTVIEPTSGNTGIGLAFMCALRGYPLILTMPESMSVERRKILRAFGAEIVLTDASKGMKGAVEKAEEIVKSGPHRYYMPQQFKNPANPEIHFRTTGPEIWRDTAGRIDILVAGVGTGGTITGISRYIKLEKRKPIISVAVEPANSAVLTAILVGKAPVVRPHKIQGIGAGFKPDVLDLSIIDRVEQISDEEAIMYSRKMAFEEGITCGISSGAAVAAALRLASRPENEGKTIVAILPDTGERYLSTELFKDVV